MGIVLVAVLAALTGAFSTPAFAEASSRSVGFSDLPGWADDDHAAAFSTFLATCRGPPSGSVQATGQPDGLAALCRRALALNPPGPDAARRFFEDGFEPVPVSGTGFLTGYYEPELDASLTPTAPFLTPLVALPAGHVPLGREKPPAFEGLTAARQQEAGLAAYPDRAAIESGALGADAQAIAYLADPVDAFMVHVQGSARLRLPDGSAIRVGFAGRNGYPYTAIGRELARDLALPPAELTADRLVAWLKAHPERAAGIMHRNRSYIFFRRIDEAEGAAGPIGAAGVALTAGRSLAVDPAQWRYGTPIWLDATLPRPDGREEVLRRLVVAQDTGAAIVGPVRGDLFFGSGAEAGVRASIVRHPARWIALVPRPVAP